MKPLRIHGLTKEYRIGFSRRSVLALDHLDLEIDEGEVFGFLGHNGAGKTTTIKLLMGLVYPTAGEAWILDRSIRDVGVKQSIGFLPESPFFYEYLTAEEFLTFYGQLFGIGGVTLTKKIDELLELVSMTDARRRPLRKFSKGMLQRIGIAQALINDPKLVILDEPMSGLDPVGRRDVRDIILRLKQEGKTIFFSSHILPDVEMICDRIAVLVKGRLKAVGTVQELAGASSVTSIELVAQDVSESTVAGIQDWGATATRRGHHILIKLEDDKRVNDVIERIIRQNGRIVSLTPHKQSLEEFFLTESGMNRI
ncbi:MAG TPA: ABC transporter ATP-binding protein [Nitrospira sp.]|nr:ABC transporter ATP-binding protein [Nitrospira sp.]